MFSKPLLRQIIRSNFRLFLIIAGVLCLLITVILSVFDPSTMQTIARNSAQLPFNPLGDLSTLINFVANQYFSLMALIFPMIYSIIVGNRLIAGQVEKGGLAYTLSTPTTRLRITRTSALFLGGSQLVLFGLIAGTGCAVAAIAQPGVLDYGKFLLLTLGGFLLQFAISGIVFFGSCLSNRSGRSLALGAGLPLAFFAFHLLAGMSKSLGFLKYFSLITLFDSKAIINGEAYGAGLIVLAAVGIILYLAGIKVFKEKDLPI